MLDTRLSENSAAGSRVTPLLLTFNEEPNLDRVLRALTWAKEVVVVDSGSTDRTVEIAGSFPNVRLVERAFDSHGQQWEFGIRNTGISTDYILALDADMEVPADFVGELERQFLPGTFAGGITPFRLVFEKRALIGGIYPAQLRIFRGEAVSVTQRGHTQVFQIDGPAYLFKNPLRHEDRKPFSRWIQAQLKYAQLELDRIEKSPETSARDRLRRIGIMPVISALLSYVRAGGPFLGRASLRYALERTVFECILAIRLIERRSSMEASGADPNRQSGANSRTQEPGTRVSTL